MEPNWLVVSDTRFKFQVHLSFLGQSSLKLMLGNFQVVFGLPPPFWLSDSFRAVVGQRQAELAIQTGKLFNPEQAFKIGLVSFSPLLTSVVF
jgi:hypothetical protein